MHSGPFALERGASSGGWPTLDPPAPCGCPILSAVSSRKGWETTNFDCRLFGLLRAEVTLSYTYYPTGKVQTITSSNPNGASVAYTYDDLNRLGTVTDGQLQGSQTTTYTYDPANNVAAVNYPNGVQSALTYDALNRITGLATQSTGYLYQRGPTGNLTGATELNGRTLTWSYDGIYRLTNEAISSDPGNNNGSSSYTLDPVGNRLAENTTLPGLSSGSFGYNADDEVNTETYDANGNTIAAGGKTFTYDSENHLTSMNGGAVTIIYDGDGNRVSKTVGGVTTQYLVDDMNPTGYAQVVEELQGSAVTRQYTYGLQRISQRQFVANAWTASFYGYDGGGNVRNLTNTAGAITDSYEYDAFGNSFTKQGTTPNVYLYRAEQYDSDLGLYYLRARYYDPITGRFLSRDPENGNRLSPASLRKYLYAGGDPVNSFDPSGRASILETGSLDAVIGSVPVPALIALAGTAAENALLATGVSDAIAGIQLAAEAGSYEEVIDIVTYTAKSILQSRPLVRAFLCSPLVLAYAYGEDQLDDYAKDHHWNFLEIQAMDKALDVPKDALAVACGAYVLGLVK